MSKVIFGVMMSLDGFINDQNGSVSRLYPDMADLHATEMLQEAIKNTGAVVMGRHSYDMGQGDYTGYEFQAPIFVITHKPPETVAKGENDKLSFTFVTDGIESAIQKAKAAAGDKDVTIVGGANIGQQCLKAGLIDELQIDMVPILLTQGLRLFESLSLGPDAIELEIIQVDQYPGFTHFRYRVVK